MIGYEFCYIDIKIYERSFVHIDPKIGGSYTQYIGSPLFCRNVGNHVPQDTASHRVKFRHNVLFTLCTNNSQVTNCSNEDDTRPSDNQVGAGHKETMRKLT